MKSQHRYIKKWIIIKCHINQTYAATWIMLSTHLSPWSGGFALVVSIGFFSGEIGQVSFSWSSFPVVLSS